MAVDERRIRPKQILLSQDNLLGGAGTSHRNLPTQRAIKEYVDANADALHNMNATTNPVVTDDSDSGYSEGSLWYNTVTSALFVLTDPSVGSAEWLLTNNLSKLSDANINMTANSTTADGQLATAVTVADEPIPGSAVLVRVNGVGVDVGSGQACYFSPDNVIIRSLTDVQQGDSLYWNGSVAGYELNATDYSIDFVYLTTESSTGLSSGSTDHDYTDVVWIDGVNGSNTEGQVGNINQPYLDVDAVPYDTLGPDVLVILMTNCNWLNPIQAEEGQRITIMFNDVSVNGYINYNGSTPLSVTPADILFEGPAPSATSAANPVTFRMIGRGEVTVDYGITADAEFAIGGVGSQLYHELAYGTIEIEGISIRSWSGNSTPQSSFGQSALNNPGTERNLILRDFQWLKPNDASPDLIIESFDSVIIDNCRLDGRLDISLTDDVSCQDTYFVGYNTASSMSLDNVANSYFKDCVFATGGAEVNATVSATLVCFMNCVFGQSAGGDSVYDNAGANPLTVRFMGYNIGQGLVDLNTAAIGATFNTDATLTLPPDIVVR